MEWLIEPLSYPFMQRAVIMAVLVASICAIFSCFLVLKGWSLMGDAVSHAVLPGITLSVITGAPLLLGAFFGGLACALGIGFIKEHSRVKEDAVMGILFSGMFALGLVMIGKIESELHILHILFGNILGLSTQDLIQTAAIVLPASAIMLIKRKDLMLYCFDQNHAKAIGLPVKLFHYGLLILLALTIVAALKSAGVILVIAMLIAPGATGFLLTHSFDRMMLIALSSAILSCMFGTWISYHLDIATAPTIVMLQFILFLSALFVNTQRKLAP